MTPSNNGLKENVPDHIKAIQNKALGVKEEQEIDWAFWHFVAVFVFRFSEQAFFEETTLRRLYSLCIEHEKFHKKNN